MNGGIRVKYSDYENFAQKYKQQLTDYKEWLELYLSYLDSVCNDAIISGKVHDALVVFRQELAKVLDMPEAVASSIVKIINDYLDDLDIAQKINGVSILYDRSYKGCRDYTSEYFVKLEKMSEQADYDSSLWNSFWDLLEEAYYGIAKFFGYYDNSKEQSIKKTHEAILQYNDVTRRQVRNIRRKIEEADEKCYERLVLVKDFIWNMEEYISVFKEIMLNYQYSPSSFDISTVDFASKYSVMIRSYNDVVVMDTVTDEDVEEFLASEEPEKFMDEQVQIIHDYLTDLSKLEMSDYDFWKLVICQMFDVAEGEILTGGEYEKLVMKKELTEMMDDLAENYVYSDSDEQEILDTVNSILEDAEKNGKTLYEYLNSIRGKDGKLVLDGRTKKAKEFLSFLDSLENAQEILKYGDQAIEILSKLFINYDKNLAFLDSFERNANLSAEMLECFKELRATYEHDLSQTVVDISRQIAENGVDVLYSISIGKMVGTVKQTIGLIGDLTGENARTAAQIELLNYGHDVVDSAQSAFLESMKKLKGASKNADNYNELMNDFKNCFAIYKNSLKRLFEKMALAAKGAQRDYFYYCSSEVSSMTLKEFSNIDFMSYEEYLKDGYTY